MKFCQKKIEYIDIVARRVILLACVTSAPSSLAQTFLEDAPSLASKQTDIIVTYGTRTALPQTELPYSVHVLSEKDLDKALPRTLPESLLAIPGVLVQKTASGHGSPYIRGFTGNRTLAVIDGIRYNNATYRDGANEYFSHIDIFTLSQIELLSGPTSTLYGSEAVGGTLSLTTRGVDYREEDETYTSAKQTLRTSSGDMSLVSRTDLKTGKGGVWDLRLGLSVKDFGDIRAADLGTLPETGYSETAYDGRLDVKLSDIWAATLMHQTLTQDDVPRTHSTVFSRSFAGTDVGTDLMRTKDQKRSLTYLKFKGTPETSMLETAEITFSLQPRTETEHRVRSDDLDINQSFTSNLWALNSVFGSHIANALFTYGLDYSLENIDSERIDFDPVTETSELRIQGPVGDDATYQQIGLFAKTNWTLSDIFGVELGGRYSYVAADIGRYEDPDTHSAISFEDSWSDVSGSLRLKADVTESSTLWAGLSQSFRAPNIADISRFGRSRSTEFEVASFGLEPEHFTTAEIGYRFNLDPLKLSATYYYTDLKNYIDTVATGRVIDDLFEVSKQNAASGSIQGVEVSGEFFLSDTLSLEANATWLEGTLTRSAEAAVGGFVTEPISRIQPLTGYIALNWGKGPLWATGELSVSDKADKLSEADLSDTQRIPPGGTPGYVLLNFKTGWDVSENMSVTFSVNNILDEAYRSHGSGTNEAGRHVTAGLSVGF